MVVFEEHEAEDHVHAGVSLAEMDVNELARHALEVGYDESSINDLLQKKGPHLPGGRSMIENVIRKRMSEQMKEDGNVHFRRGDLDLAAKRYELAVRCTIHFALNRPACSNLALMRIKLQQPKLAVEAATLVLESDAIDKRYDGGDGDIISEKALYRRGLALEMMGDFEASLTDLERACARGTDESIATDVEVISIFN